MVGIIREFCSERVCGDARILNKALFNKIKDSVLFTNFDGAPYAQLSGVQLCREHFKKALGAEKDSFHDFIKLTEEAAKKDADWGPTRLELFSKKHAIIKDLHYAMTVKDQWRQWQKEVIHQEGAQGGAAQVIDYMPYAPTRAAVEADCLEVLCRTIKATLGTMSDRINKSSTLEILQAYTQTLDKMQTSQWLRVGLNADKKIIERQTLRRFDSGSAFLPMKTRILQKHMETMWAMVHEGGLISDKNTGTITTVVIQTIRDNPKFQYGEHILALSDESLDAKLEAELKALQRQSRATNKLLEEHNNPEYMMNKSQCFDLCRWETISKEEAVRLPWTGRDARLNHREHRAMLYENFEYFCKACQVCLPDRKQLFDVWRTAALSIWKRKKSKFPGVREEEEANYDGEIMLDSWIEAFRRCELAALTPIMECVACICRNTTPTERTLKTIAKLAQSDGPSKSIQLMNDCLLVKDYIAQDPKLLEGPNCPFYQQFVHNWMKWQGQRWCVQKKIRSDKGRARKYVMQRRYPKSRLNKKLWKSIARVCREHREGGAENRKALTGQNLKTFEDKTPRRIDDFSEAQTKYLKHHTESGADVKRRKLQEKQRAKGRRFCQPTIQPVPKAKTKPPEALATAHHRSFGQSLSCQKKLKVFFPKGFCAQYLGGRAQEIEGFKCFKHVTDLLDADIIAVPSLSRLNDRVPRNVLGDQKVELLHTDMLVARVLGKRVAEPEFFRQVTDVDWERSVQIWMK